MNAPKLPPLPRVWAYHWSGAALAAGARRAVEALAKKALERGGFPSGHCLLLVTPGLTAQGEPVASVSAMMVTPDNPAEPHAVLEIERLPIDVDEATIGALAPPEDLN